ncbi:MAG: hypothetical protein KGJ51_06555 [Acidobacteriota bacterium]|nr:hypothetical protein [Acidobacteriota bacterium]MDE3162216.1 hypothetical protein [Acidobacteriota bacterium]
MTHKTAPASRRFWQIDPNHLTVRDVLVLIPIVLLSFALIIGLNRWIGRPDSTKWGGLVLDTGVLFLFLIYKSKDFLLRKSFWMFVTLFFAFHLAVWITFLLHVEQWGLLGFNLMAFEVLPFFYFRDMFR